jgi:hypothetical protein
MLWFVPTQKHDEETDKRKRKKPNGMDIYVAQVDGFPLSRYE